MHQPASYQGVRVADSSNGISFEALVFMTLELHHDLACLSFFLVFTTLTPPFAILTPIFTILTPIFARFGISTRNILADSRILVGRLPFHTRNRPHSQDSRRPSICKG